MSWYWDLSSKEFGTETVGPYDTKNNAIAGINRVQEEVEKLDDGVLRFYNEPYEVQEGERKSK